MIVLNSCLFSSIFFILININIACKLAHQTPLVLFPSQGLGWEGNGQRMNLGRGVSFISLGHHPAQVTLITHVLVCKISAKCLSLPASVPLLEQGPSVRLSLFPHLRHTAKPFPCSSGRGEGSLLSYLLPLALRSWVSLWFCCSVGWFCWGFFRALFQYE